MFNKFFKFLSKKDEPNVLKDTRYFLDPQQTMTTKEITELLTLFMKRYPRGASQDIYDQMSPELQKHWRKEKVKF